MDTKFLENKGDGSHKVYDSVLVDPKHMGILSNKITQDILKRLSQKRLCAMDVARELGQHEQKIYYHMRKLEKAGVIKAVGTERRAGMTAKMFTLTSPIISTKISDEGHKVERLDHSRLDLDTQKLMKDFIADGSLNAKIIIGDANPHGKYEKSSRAPVYLIDFFLMLGKCFSKSNYPHFSVDTELKEPDLKGNLIIIGNPQSNSIADKINEHLPLFFAFDPEWCIKSKIKKRKYTSTRTGLIAKYSNPFNKGSKILWIAGVGQKGARSASIALTEYMDKVMSNMDDEGHIFRVVEGLDKNADGVIDSVKFLE